MYVALFFNNDVLKDYKDLSADNLQDAEFEAEKARKQARAEYFVIDWKE